MSDLQTHVYDIQPAPKPLDSGAQQKPQVGGQNALVPSTTPLVVHTASRDPVSMLMSGLQAVTAPAVRLIVIGAIQRAIGQRLGPLGLVIANAAAAKVVDPITHYVIEHGFGFFRSPSEELRRIAQQLISAWNNPAALVKQAIESFTPSFMSQSPGQQGRSIRQWVVAGVYQMGYFLMSRALGGPQPSWVMSLLVPGFAATLSRLTDVAIYALLPTANVEASEAPKAGQSIKLFGRFDAKITAAEEARDGFYDVTLQLAPKDGDWCRVDGVVTLRTRERRGDDLVIEKVASLAGAKLSLGKPGSGWTLGSMTATWSPQTGLAITSATATADGGDKRAFVLGSLTISPLGWITGTATIGGKASKLGSLVANGWSDPDVAASAAPGAEADKASKADPSAKVAPVPSRSGGGGPGLVENIHGKLSASPAGALIAPTLQVIAYLTGEEDLVGPPPVEEKPKAPQPSSEASPARSESGPFASFDPRALHPANLLAKIRELDLVPDVLRSNYPQLDLKVSELAVTREPALTMGGSIKIQLFEAMPTAHAEGLNFAWLPKTAPHVFFRVASLGLGDNLSVTGLEADPDGGLRAVSAKIAFPIDTKVLSLEKLEAGVDYLQIGKTFGFRSAYATATNLDVAGGALRVDRLGFTAEPAAGDLHRYRAALQGARLKATEEHGVPLGGDAWIAWGGGKQVAGGGKVAGGPISLLDGKITCTKLDGDFSADDGKIAASLAVTDARVRWGAYEVRATAASTFDGEGLARLEVTSGEVWKNGAKVGAAENVLYVRGKTLSLGRIHATMPEDGPLRATRAAAEGGAPALDFRDVDLSSLVSKPEPAVSGASSPAPAEDAPKKKRASLKQKNLKRLEIGPPGAALMTIEPAAASGSQEPAPDKDGYRDVSAADIQIHLGPVSTPKIRLGVEPSEQDPDVLVFEGSVPTAYGTFKVKYDGTLLTVAGASIPLAELLGKLLPADVFNIKSAVNASFTVDVKKRELSQIDVSGSMSGSLFGDHVTIGAASADLHVKPGPIAESGGGGILADPHVTGSVTVTAAKIALFGIEVTLGGSFSLDPTKLALAGKGTLGDASVEITGLTALADFLRVDQAVLKMKPPEGGPIKFLPPGDQVDEEVQRAGDHEKLVIELHGVLFGKDQQARSSEGSTVAIEGRRDGAEAPAPSKQEQDAWGVVAKNLPTLDIGNGAVQVGVKGVDIHKVQGKNEISIGGAAALKLGPLTGDLGGQLTINLDRAKALSSSAKPKAPPARDAPGRAREEAPAEPDVPEVVHGDGAVRFVASGRIGRLTVTNAIYGGDILRIEKIEAPVGALLDQLPGTLDSSIAEMTASIANLQVDVKTGQLVGPIVISALSGPFTAFGGALSLGSAGLDVELGGGKKLTGDASTPLLPKGWSITATAKKGELRLFEGDITGGIADARIKFGGAALVDGHVKGVSLTAYGVGAGFEELLIKPNGFGVKQLSVTASTGALARRWATIAGADLVPTWMDGADSGLVLKVGFDTGITGGKIDLPTNLTFGVRKAKFGFGPVTGSFDRDAGTIGLKLTKKGEFKVGAQIPFGQSGLGLEAGGMFDYLISGDVSGALAKNDDALEVAAGLLLTAKLDAVVYLGIYGGLPNVLSVSGGVYGGMALNASLMSRITGQWRTPKRKEDKGGGQLDFNFNFKDPSGAYPLLTGHAGAYVSVHFFGTSKTLKKDFASAPLAWLHAHGGLRLETGKDLVLLPSAGEFPYYKLHMHEGLRERFFDKDYTTELGRAQHRIDDKLAKVVGAEDLLALNAPKPASADDGPADGSKAKSPPAPEPKPTDKVASAEQQREIHDEAVLANARYELAKSELETFDEGRGSRVKLLPELRKKLAEYQWKLDELRKLKADGGNKVSLKDRAKGAAKSWHNILATFNVKEGEPVVDGRKAVGEKNASARVAGPKFPKEQGLETSRGWLTIADLEAKVAFKAAEIELIEKNDQVEARDALAEQVAITGAENSKADFMDRYKDKTRTEVEKRLEVRQDKLLGELAEASQVQAEMDDARIRSGVQRGTLEKELLAAKSELARLGSAEAAPSSDRPSPEPSDPAKLAGFQVTFWKEHVKFLEEEIALHDEQEAARRQPGARYTDGLADGQQEVVKRAAKARPDTVGAIDDKMRKRIEARRTEIEASLHKLQEIHQQLIANSRSAKPTAQKSKADVQLEQIENAIARQKGQLAAYIENVHAFSEMTQPPKS